MPCPSIFAFYSAFVLSMLNRDRVGKQTYGKVINTNDIKQPKKPSNAKTLFNLNIDRNP